MNTPNIIQAPFTEEQVENLNAYQKDGSFHEFTCGATGCRKPLIATKEGWICECGKYKQNWAHKFMTEKREE